jgi:hypothetical protein
VSQAPRGKHDWIRNHYEKLLLLVALVALLLSSAFLVQQIQADQEDFAFSVQRLSWKGSPEKLVDTLPFDAVLAEARKAAATPLTVAPRTTVSELRVGCVKCGRPISYEAIECPFCLAVQPDIVDIKNLDTDEDGIPDQIELLWGLDPQDMNDALMDQDRDGFSNYEEFRGETDPKDPDSSPDPVVKLRVAVIKAVPFYLRFVGTSKFGDGSVRYQLNMQSKERTYFAKLGDIILGYKVESYDPEGKGGAETLNMVRQSDKRSVDLIKGRPVTEQELKILFVSLLDRSKLPPQRLKDVFTLRGVDYKVVDIRRESVLIQNVKTAEKVVVPLLTNEERTGTSSRPSASP